MRNQLTTGKLSILCALYKLDDALNSHGTINPKLPSSFYDTQRRSRAPVQVPGRSFQQLSIAKTMKLCSRWLTITLIYLLFPWPVSQSSANTPQQRTMPLSRSRQCLLVVTPSWQSTNGVLAIFERAQDGAIWLQRGGNIPVVVGKNGLAWGRGIAGLQTFRGPVKREGDERAPAGIFRLSSAFGYGPVNEVRHIKLPYVALTEQSEAIDDPTSRYYNQLVERSRISAPDWHSSEKMRLPGNPYRWGIVIDHNTPPVKGAGSCIFLHVWRGPARPTSGCTAMAEQNLKALLAWLDPQANPVIVQLPFQEFERLRSDWHLPQER